MMKKKTTTERLMKAQDVADVLGIHLLTVYARGKAGTLPGRIVLPGTKSVRFVASVIERIARGD